ncbi:DUF6056 family protein [Clostridium sp. SHJSY1]|uniref:DUF6056 family protein n=1 Tax=Clostridium sp. SHJSY1 TaxID=2942483 RepID=UPI0028765B29|nr:DUF6056 family protein [Clostridium sp. SHJSY1]MDS0526881.1 DUF6056 family protein [Clostridium sp. SHJSY1]
MKFIYSTLKNPKLYLYVLIFTIMFLLTSNMYFTPDEYNYSHIPWTDIKISSLSDILYSQKILYLNWTGRIIVHSLIQLFLFIGNYSFPIINSLIFCIFIYLISNFISIKKTPYIVLLTFALIWILTPVFGETTIWLSGAINYLWPSTLLLFLLNIYSKNKIKTPWLMLIAFITGATHEMIFICGGTYLLLDLCINKFNRKKFLIFSCFLVGGLFLILAPGNFIRASHTSSILRKVNIIKILIGLILFSIAVFINTKLKDIFIRYVYILKKGNRINIFSYLFILFFFILLICNISNNNYINSILFKIYNLKFILILIPLFTFLILKCIKNDIPIERLLFNINLLFVGLISSLAMNVMPECPSRSFFLSCTIINIAIINLFCYLGLKKLYFLNSAIFILCFITLSLTLHYYIISLGSWIKEFNTQISNDISSQIILQVQPNPVSLINNYYTSSPFSINPNSVTNCYAARYYKLKEIIGIQENTNTIKIEKDNLDKNSIYFEFTNSDGITEKSYPENVLVDSSKSELDSRQAYILIPSDATNVKLINNSNLLIIDNDITTYSLN